MKYSPKRAAMILIDNWLTIGGSSPHWMDNEEMEASFSTDLKWKITDKRRDDIIEQVDKILEPLRNRVSNFVANL